MASSTPLIPCLSLSSPCTLPRRSKKTRNSLNNLKKIPCLAWSKKYPKISRKNMNKPWKNSSNRKINPSKSTLPIYLSRKGLNSKEGQKLKLSVKKSLNKGLKLWRKSNKEGKEVQAPVHKVPVQAVHQAPLLQNLKMLEERDTRKEKNKIRGRTLREIRCQNRDQRTRKWERRESRRRTQSSNHVTSLVLSVGIQSTSLALSEGIRGMMKETENETSKSEEASTVAAEAVTTRVTADDDDFIE